MKFKKASLQVAHFLIFCVFYYWNVGSFFFRFHLFKIYLCSVWSALNRIQFDKPTKAHHLVFCKKLLIMTTKSILFGQNSINISFERYLCCILFPGLSHIYGEGNALTDKLANFGAHNGGSTWCGIPFLRSLHLIMVTIWLLCPAIMVTNLCRCTSMSIHDLPLHNFSHYYVVEFFFISCLMSWERFSTNAPIPYVLLSINFE